MVCPLYIPLMILAFDSHYSAGSVTTAYVEFAGWADQQAADSRWYRLPAAAPYQPEQFYKRELPGILHALQQRGTSGLQYLLIDGYVALDAEGRPGLGAHLYRALEGRYPVIGVAKNPFRGSPHAYPLTRGGSKKPLYITAAGIPAEDATRFHARMHGPHPVATTLGQVDQLCRKA